MSDEVKSLKNVLKDGPYHIPEYQRGYDWKEEHVRDFMHDLRHIVTSNDGRERDEKVEHYFGTIIRVINKDKNEDLLSDETSPDYYVLDGQQRLTTSTLAIGYLTRRIYDLASGLTTEEAENLRDGVIRHTNLVFQSTDAYHTKPEKSDFNFLPSEPHSEAYRKLIYAGGVTETQSPSSDNMKAAYSSIEEQVESICTELPPKDFEEEELEKAYKMSQILRDLLENFVVTRYTVDSPSEAGLLFQAVNDRGKSLSVADKIKSYLVHVVSQEDVDIDPVDIHHKFTEVKETLHKLPGDTEDMLKTFTQQHWYMFTGQLEINKAHTVKNRGEASSIVDQIKYGEHHLNRERSAEEIEDWVETYVDSLSEAVDAYCRVKEPQNFYESKEFTDLLCAIEQFMPSRQLSGLLGMQLAFEDPSSEYIEALESLETLVVRSYEVPKVQNSEWRRDFAEIGCDLAWGTIDASRGEIIGVESEPNYSKSNLSDCFENFLANHSEVDIGSFGTLIGEKGLIDGAHLNGWGGARNDTQFALYLLYKYEKHSIRSDSDMGSLDSYAELTAGEENDITYEHIWPENRENNEVPSWVSIDDEDQYGSLIQYIGNGLMLIRPKNSEIGKDPYSDKYREYLDNDSKMATSKTLPSPDSGWTRENIEQRSKDIGNWAKRYWATDDEKPVEEINSS